MLNQFTNFPLRLGEIKEIIYPDDVRSQSQKFIEYRVRVIQRNGSGAVSSVDYRTCYVGGLFGGAADRFYYTLRPSSQLYPTNDLRDGNQVILLCINGETSNAVIIGSIPNERQGNDKKDDGHNLHFEFNGINAIINKDGEFIFTHKGPTDLTGKVTAEVKNNAITFAKDGTVSLTSSGVLIGAATDNLLLGSTYRKAQAELHQKLAVAFQAMFTSLTAAANALIGTPVTVAATPLFNAATNALAASTYLKQFEASASTYLSKVNKSD